MRTGSVSNAIFAETIHFGLQCFCSLMIAVFDSISDSVNRKIHIVRPRPGRLNRNSIHSPPCIYPTTFQAIRADRANIRREWVCSSPIRLNCWQSLKNGSDITIKCFLDEMSSYCLPLCQRLLSNWCCAYGANGRPLGKRHERFFWVNWPPECFLF